MFAIIGIVVVFGAVIAGFLTEKGHLLVLMQPAELVTIGGAALGTMLIANSRQSEDDVRVFDQGAQGRSGRGRGRHREAEGEQDLPEVSGVSQGPSCGGICVRHAADDAHRGRGSPATPTGAVDGLGELGAPSVAAERDRRPTHLPGARIRGSNAAGAGRSVGCSQPAGHADCAVGEPCGGAEVTGAGATTGDVAHKGGGRGCSRHAEGEGTGGRWGTCGWNCSGSWGSIGYWSRSSTRCCETCACCGSSG
jgi:hypothetical protein